MCVSSQVGCKLKCSFCATGGLGFTRNLLPEEIFDQVVAVKRREKNGDYRYQHRTDGHGRTTSELRECPCRHRTHHGRGWIGMSPYRLTLSTSGIVEGIKRLADDDVRFNLAISLHSAVNTTRDKIMPINKAYPLTELAEAIRYFVDKTGTRPTFEYLLLKGVNDRSSTMPRLSPCSVDNSP